MDKEIADKNERYFKTPAGKSWFVFSRTGDWQDAIMLVDETEKQNAQILEGPEI